MTFSSKNPCLKYLLVILKGRAHGIFHRAYTHIRVFLLEDVCNWLPGLRSNIPQKKVPLPPLSVGGLTDRLSQLSQ